MIEVVGWVGTLFVLIGYVLNVKRYFRQALIVWILGDVLWIFYDVMRGIYPHLGLCLVIITINFYGLVASKKQSQ